MTDEMVSMPREALDELLEKAAERGARRALGMVALGDPDAAKDVQEARNLLAMYRIVRAGMLKQLGQIIGLIVFGAVVFMVGQKYYPGAK